MGCEVVSVYNDEIIGKIGYPQALIDDLIDRDYRQLKPLQKPKETTNKIRHIYGFTQSFTTTRLYFTMVKQIECLVYVAGRFIIKEELKSKEQKIITNPEYITAFSVTDKLCLVGLVGGTLLLWDLEFLETKLQILLPQDSTTISTVGFTQKYIFATDSSTPNNIAYCYDLRTGQLLSGKPIPSLQPAVRSISIAQNLHITACADGIWILKMEKREGEMQVIKGMFGRFPKTSICSLAKIGQYLLGGGVDGYLYVWKISTLRCCRALKVSDSEIVSIGVKERYLIFGCLGGRVKVYTFQVKKKEKKQYALQAGENEEDDQDFAFIVVDSFSKEGSTIAIATSIFDPYLYYCMTRQGLLYEKFLPAPTSERKKINLQSRSQTIVRVNTSGSFILQQSKIYSTYRAGKAVIMVDVYSIDHEKLVLQQQRMALLGEDSQNILAYSPIFQQIVYLTSSNKIVTSVTFNKVVESVSHENKSDIGSNTQHISSIQHEKVLAINFVQKGSLLCVTSNESIWIYRRTGRISYEEIDHIKYQKTIPALIRIEQSQLIYEKQCQSWRLSNEENRSIRPQEISHYQVVHTSQPKSLWKSWLEKKASIGGGFIILWK